MTNVISVDFKVRKKLSEADFALLRSRGKVTSLTTVTDFDIPSSWEKPKTKTTKKTTNKHPLVGKVLHTSWGYDMTINNFCKIVDVSPSGKTVVCRMLTKEGFNGFQGEVKCGKEIGPKFRLKVGSGYHGNPSFNGSYPYCGADRHEGEWLKVSESSTRMVYFSLHDPDHKVWENHMD